MATAESMTITFEPGVSDSIRRRAEEGHFASPSEYIESLIVADMLEPSDEQELVHWMQTEGARRLQALHDDPARGLSIDEAFAGLIDKEEG